MSPNATETTRAARVFASPLGPLHLHATDAGICALLFDTDSESRRESASPAADAHLDLLVDELTRYFAGTLSRFTVPLDPRGTVFQQRVWSALQTIPCGQTRSYADIARAIGNPAAVRAVGLANGCNPIAIVIPCHRVIGSSGELTGYGGGLPRKRWLLDHERRWADVSGELFDSGPITQKHAATL